MTDGVKTQEGRFSLRPLLEYSRKRRLELRRPDGRIVFALSLPWLAGLGLVALLTHLLLPALAVGVVLLILRYEYVVTRTTS